MFVTALLQFLGCLQLAPNDRYAATLVGGWLRTMLEPGETVGGDMTRVIWFAGCRPLPPRHFTVEELVARSREPSVRFVVLAGRREGRDAVAAALDPMFTPTGMPLRETRAAGIRGMLVLERRL